MKSFLKDNLQAVQKVTLTWQNDHACTFRNTTQRTKVVKTKASSSKFFFFFFARERENGIACLRSHNSNLCSLRCRS